MNQGNVIRACWIVFILYWVISAISSKPVGEKPDRASMWIYRLPMMMGVVMLFPRWQPTVITIVIFSPSGGLAWLGAAVCVLGLAGAVWSRRTLGRNWSSDVLFRQGHQLIECGPYRFVRHPIYTSILMMFLGTAIAEDSVSAFLGVLFFFAGIWIKLRQEEALMARHFPDQYSDYKKRVKALIPFVL